MGMSFFQQSIIVKSMPSLANEHDMTSRSFHLLELSSWLATIANTATTLNRTARHGSCVCPVCPCPPGGGSSCVAMPWRHLAHLRCAGCAQALARAVNVELRAPRAQSLPVSLVSRLRQTKAAICLQSLPFSSSSSSACPLLRRFLQPPRRALPPRAPTCAW